MGAKMGEKPPGMGTATSIKRSTLVMATITPSMATVLALSAWPCNSTSSATSESPTRAVVTSVASWPWATPSEAVPRVSRKKG